MDGKTQRKTPHLQTVATRQQGQNWQRHGSNNPRLEAGGQVQTQVAPSVASPGPWKRAGPYVIEPGQDAKRAVKTPRGGSRTSSI
jgi:hypothetical protein